MAEVALTHGKNRAEIIRQLLELMKKNIYSDLNKLKKDDEDTEKRLF